MNPWGFVIIGLGVLAVIIGVTGSYENVKGAITGHSAAAPTPKKTATQPKPTPPPGVKPTPKGTLV
jgi:hypothetical protein